MTTFTIKEPRSIGEILQDDAGAVVELFLDAERASYATSLWRTAPATATGEPSVWLSPLEPSLGNIRIRHARRVRLRTFSHDASLEGWCHFLGLYREEGLPHVEVSLPEMLIRSTVRHESRVELSRRRLVARILPAGWLTDHEAEVNDISAEGMALSTAEEVDDLPEQSHLAIRLPVPGERELLLEGTVQSRHTLRHSDDPYRVIKRYGIHFDYYRLDRGHLRRFSQFLADLGREGVAGTA